MARSRCSRLVCTVALSLALAEGIALLVIALWMGVLR